MRRIAALAAPVAAALLGCGSQGPTMPSACVDADAAGYARALAAAPGPVRLPGGVAISACLRTVRTAADLQTLSTILSTVAEDVAAQARRYRDASAALRLGYLAGAVSAGAAHSGGVSAELAYRIANAARGVDAVSLELSRALERGNAAGRARG